LASPIRLDRADIRRGGGLQWGWLPGPGDRRLLRQSGPEHYGPAGRWPWRVQSGHGSPFAGGSNPKSIAVGDVNGDGIQDLAIASDVSGNAVTVLLGNGLGGFSPAVGGTFASGASHTSVVIGGFQRDGRADLLTTTNGNSVTALLGGFCDYEFAAEHDFRRQAFHSGRPCRYTYRFRYRHSVKPAHVRGNVLGWRNGSGRGCPDREPLYLQRHEPGGRAPHADATYNGDARSTASASNSVTITVTSTNPTISGLSPFRRLPADLHSRYRCSDPTSSPGRRCNGHNRIGPPLSSARTSSTAPVSAAQIASAGP